MKTFKKIWLAGLAAFVLSCSKENNSQTTPAEDYFRGNLTVLADDAYASVGEALAEGYSIQYPEAKIAVKKTKENEAIASLLRGKAEAVIISRQLSTEEQKLYTQQAGQEYKPAIFAADAVVFITGKNSAKESLTTEEIKVMLTDPGRPLIFDGANAGNLNFVAEKLKMNPQQLQFSVLPGNRNVAENIAKYPNSVGVVSLGTFSREYDPESKALREKIKILPIVTGNRTLYPEQKNLANLSYPFTRQIYLLSSQRGFKLAGGLMRYAGSQTGQLIVEKEGLQPYYLYKRTVQMR